MLGGTRVVSLRRSIYRAHALGRTGRKQSAEKSLATVIDMEESFNFRLYVYVPTGNHRVQLFKDAGSEMALVPHSLVLAKDQFFLGAVALTLLQFMLESKKGVMVCNPQRVCVCWL